LLRLNHPFSGRSEATKGTLDDCDIESVDEACLEYGKQLDELATVMKVQQPNIQAMKEMAESIKQIKLAPPKPATGAASAKLEEALAEAKAVTAEKGLASPEARVAWENVEEIASAGTSNAMGGLLTEDECLIDAALEACAAMEELNRLLEARK
jgi:CP12 domain